MTRSKKKGKMPKGRAGAKQKAQKGGPSGSNMGSMFVRGSDMSRQMLEDDYDDEPQQFFRGFAQTNRPVKSNPSALKLRHQPIAFVSSSTNLAVEHELQAKLHLSEEKEVFVAAENTDSEGEREDIEVDFELDSDIQTNLVVEAGRNDIAEAGTSLEDSHISEMVQDEETLPFVMDTKGDPHLASSFKQSTPRPPSPAASDSGEEVVVFHGRSKASNISTPSSSTRLTDRRRAPPEEALPKENVRPAKFEPRPQGPPTTQSTGPRLPPAAAARGWTSRTSKTDAEVNPHATWAPAPAVPYWKKDKAKYNAPRPDPGRSLQHQQATKDTPNGKGKDLATIPQGDGAVDIFIDDETFKKIERLAKITRVQAKDDASPPKSKKKKEKMQTRISNIAMLESELSTEHVELARRMGVEEAIRIDEAATERMKEKGRESLRAFYGSDYGSEHSDAEDTIASLQADWNAILREKGKLKGSNRGGKRGRRKDNQALRQPIVSEDEGSMDEEAFNDYLENLVAEAEGDEEGDEEEKDFAAGMINSDDSSDSTGPIGQDRSDLSSSELEDDLEYTEQEQWEDEDDLRRRRQERMTDEQIARIFAKQEELGIYGDEMVIENGEYGSFSDGFGDVTAARAGLANLGEISFGRKSNKHGMRRRNNHGNLNFPDASALADSVEQYGENGFDIMDFDRPSLRPKHKGRRGQPPPELEGLSDEELRDNMVDAWDNDRVKKRLKKMEREELRAQGMLGATGKKGKSDLSQKYQFGMTTKQIHNELRTFLQNDGQQSRPFPPMPKFDRKELHDLANALNLNSKSVGTGKNRFPVLVKTRRTLPFDPDMFNRVVAASESGGLDRDKRRSRRLGGKAGGKKAKGGFGGQTADATIRNGEVVGAGAAEIGNESFGHKLMEKMGWSKGMALGKEGEGRLMPVEQVMRAGRGGLGDR